MKPSFFRYAEYIIVQDLKYLVKVPDHVSLSVAAMLPTGALLAMNTVIHAREYTDQLFKEKGENGNKEYFKPYVDINNYNICVLQLASKFSSLAPVDSPFGL
jgi:hypothetical protein